MKTVDKSKDISNTIFRGANFGIKTMCGASFYSFEKEIAEDYANMEEKACLYAFDVTGLKLMVVDDNESIDDGMDNFTEEEVLSYDGVRTKNYAQVLMFGSFDCKTGEFSKLSYSELVDASNSNYRRYDR